MTETLSYAAILANLSLLDEQLAQLGLEQFLVFNRAYIVVTRTIKDSSESGYFRHPEFVERFTAAFARHYFEIVQDILAGSESRSTAWNKLVEARSHPHCIELLMGANAHINHDLPLVMVECMDGEFSDELFRDILSIDRLLLRSGRKIIPLFDESYKYLGFVKKHLRFLYYMPVMYMILYWRLSAWRRYKQIKKSGLNVERFQTKSTQIANRLFNLGMYLKF